MANRSNKQQAASSGTTKKKSCCCRQCAHAHLIQYGNNPVIAECPKKRNEGNQRFPYAVDVASSLKYCEIFKQRTAPEEIEHRSVPYTTLKGELAA